MGGVRLALGTDVAVSSENYWSLSLEHVQIKALYRGNTVGIVSLSDGLAIAAQGSTTFRVDMVPTFSNPTQSALDYAEDCGASPIEVPASLALQPAPAPPSAISVPDNATTTAALPSSSETPPDALAEVGHTRVWPLNLVVEVLPGWLWLPMITVTVDVDAPCQPARGRRLEEVLSSSSVSSVAEAPIGSFASASSDACA